MFVLTNLSSAPTIPCAKRLPRSALALIALTITFVVGACGETKPDTGAAAAIEQNTVDQSTSEQRNYLEAPTPITSATQILSGGWLLRGDGTKPQFDTIVVIRDGMIVGIGKRGTVDVPADSVGVDASGKWILPGSSKQLSAAFGKRKHDQPTQFSSTELPAIGVGRSADLVLLNSNPLTDPQALSDIHAIVSKGQVEVLSNDPT